MTVLFVLVADKYTAYSGWKVLAEFNTPASCQSAATVETAAQM
jgi:hypothetical protein